MKKLLHTNKTNSSPQERVEITSTSVDASFNPWTDLKFGLHTIQQTFTHHDLNTTELNDC